MTKQRAGRGTVNRRAASRGPKGLTPKQQRFVAEYRVDLNATRAAKRAGYSAKTAMQQGARLLSNVEIARAVAEVTRQHLDEVGVTAKSVLEAIRRTVSALAEDVLHQPLGRRGDVVQRMLLAIGSQPQRNGLGAWRAHAERRSWFVDQRSR